MAVNKQYAKYLERFGEPASDKSAPENGTSERRGEEANIGSLSPQIEMLKESADMQRSSNKFSPPGTTQRSANRTNEIQQRMQSLSQTLSKIPNREFSFKGSFQRAPQIPKPHEQPEKPFLACKGDSEQQDQVRPKLALATEGTPSSSQNRLKLKLADYLSPKNATSQKHSPAAFKQQFQQVTDPTSGSRITRREHARQLFGLLESVWLPLLLQIKFDAFATLLAHKKLRTAETGNYATFGKDRDEGASERTAQSNFASRKESKGSEANQRVPLALSTKQQFIAEGQAKPDWRSTTPRAVSSNQKKTPSPRFNFEELEKVQREKYQQLVNLGAMTASNSEPGPHDTAPRTQDFDLSDSEGTAQEDGVESISAPLMQLQPVSQEYEMMSPMQNLRAGYQFPNKVFSASINSPKQKLDSERVHQFHPELRSSYNHELGEPPVSVRPTDFDSQSQLMFQSNSDFRTILDQGPTSFQNTFSGSKTVQKLDRSSPPASDMIRLERSRKVNQDDSSVEQLDLDFLHDDDEKLKHKRGTTQGVKGASDAEKGEVDASTEAKRKTILAIQPLMSIFSADMLSKANRVNQEVSAKIAKIKAMQEQILRPRDTTKSKSSARSGRQMSDQDFDRLTKELSQNINLKKITSSEVKSELDRSVDICEKSLNENRLINPATVEYFAPESAKPNNRKLGKSTNPSKRSFDMRPDSARSTLMNAESLGSIFVHEQQQSPNTLQSREKFGASFNKAVTEVNFNSSNAADTKQQNSELRRLKMQNGLLIIGNRFTHISTVTKQVYLTRWRLRVQRQRNVLAKWIQVAKKLQKSSEQLSLKRGFQAWKTMKDRLIQEAILEELNSVQTLQKNLLTNIMRSFTHKREQRVLTRHFNAYLELFKTRVSKRKGCLRLERVLRRQVHKRQRNFWKAINQQSFVSDLGDEEVFSLASGGVTASSAMNMFRQYTQSPIGMCSDSTTGARVSPPRAISSELSTRKTQHFDPNVSQDEKLKLVKIKGGAKMVTISLRRQINQNIEPSVKDLFDLWKILVRCHKTRNTRGSPATTTRKMTLSSLPEVAEFRTTGRAAIDSRGETRNPNQLHSQRNTISFSKNKDNFEHRTKMVAETFQPSYLSSVLEKPSKPIEEVYKMGKPSSRRQILDHEVRADMCSMLEAPRPSMLSSSEQKGLKKPVQAPLVTRPDHRDEIETTSDISSVNLDSDDSCFAASVEVIRLAPVKKHKEEGQVEEKMPSTTHGSQFDPNERHLRTSRDDLVSDGGQIRMLNILTNEVLDDEAGNNNDEQNISRSPPIDDFQAQQKAMAQRQKKMKPPAQSTTSALSPALVSNGETKSPLQTRHESQTGPQQFVLNQSSSPDFGDRPSESHFKPRRQSMEGSQSKTKQNLTNARPVYHKQPQFSRDALAEYTQVVREIPQAQKFSTEDSVGAHSSERKSKPSAMTNAASAQGHNRVASRTPQTKQNATGSAFQQQPSCSLLRGSQDDTRFLRSSEKQSKQFFGRKSNSLANSSKQVSQSSEKLKKESETPQFRRSIISNKGQRADHKAEEATYYEISERQVATKNKKAVFHVLKVAAKRVTSAKDRAQSKEEVKHDPLIEKLAKVAEAQIAAEVALNEKKQKRRTRQLTKELERKTNLMFQKKDLRGNQGAPQTFPHLQASQLLASLAPQIKEVSAKPKTKQVPAKAPPIHRTNSEKGSFVSSSKVTKPQLALDGLLSQKSCRSAIVTPTRSTTPKLSRPHNYVSITSKATPKRQRLVKVNIQACLNNELRVKMPFGTLQSQFPLMPLTTRTSEITQRSEQVSVYNQMAKNPFKSQTKKRASSNLKRSNSKSSLRSISDRPLKTTYEPPAYKSRAFRSRQKKGSQQNLDLSKCGQVQLDEDNFQSVAMTMDMQPLISQMTLNSDQILKTSPHIAQRGLNGDNDLEEIQTNIILSQQQKPLTRFRTDVLIAVQSLDESRPEGEQQPMVMPFQAQTESSAQKLHEERKFEVVEFTDTPDWHAEREAAQFKIAQTEMRVHQLISEQRSYERNIKTVSRTNQCDLQQPDSCYEMAGHGQYQSDDGAASMLDQNFTLGKHSELHSLNQLESLLVVSPENSLRRLTFGRNMQAESTLRGQGQARSQNEVGHISLSQEQLTYYEHGLSLLTKVLTPRLERYKVELFIHLCEILDEAESSEDGYEQRGPNQHTPPVDSHLSTEEDVYGRYDYQKPTLDRFQQFHHKI